jgi:hypothetical protein
MRGSTSHRQRRNAPTIKTTPIPAIREFRNSVAFIHMLLRRYKNSPTAHRSASSADFISDLARSEMPIHIEAAVLALFIESFIPACSALEPRSRRIGRQTSP